MIRAGLSHKTGKSMGHVAMSGDDGAIARLADLTLDRKIFLHINNSNPALLPASPERKAAEAAGWQIPADGTEIVL
ncbi:coenzyme PQQ biosynthesis protein B [Bradyrhizobium sp. LB7.2]